MSFQQCGRKLWLSVFRKELEVISSGGQAVFDTGNEVGEFARRQVEAQFGGGTLIDVRPHGWTEGVARCESALAQAGLQVLFEAPFVASGVGVLVDIVVRDAGGALTLIEVKSSTSLKGKPYLDDAAVQAWTMAAAGYPPDRVVLRLLDCSWVYQGDGNYDGLFKDIDVTDEVTERFEKIPALVRNAQLTLEGQEPEIAPGKQCGKPFPCGFGSHCQAWDAARRPPPTPNPVDILLRRYMGSFTRDEKKSLKDGTYVDLADLPAEFPEDPRTRAIVKSLLHQTPWMSGNLVSALDEVPYPRHHFDFETIAFAVPRWKATSPYQQVPFQWSCHVEQEDGSVAHHEFLDISGNDPREECARRIVELIGKTSDGAVVVYSQSFEETRLKEMARDIPKHAAGLKRVIARLVDLLPIFRAHYFHPDLNSSWSIKKLLPTVAPELDYSTLVEVQDGGGAQRAYLEAISTADSTRRAALRSRMLTYCARDTEAMLRLMRLHHSSITYASHSCQERPFKLPSICSTFLNTTMPSSPRLLAFVRSRLPMVKHDFATFDGEVPTHSEQRVKIGTYALTQAFFYAADLWVDKPPLVSTKALEYANQRWGSQAEKVWTLKRAEIPRVDGCKISESGLIYEHVTTGGMFREHIHTMLAGGNLNAPAVASWIQENFQTAWVTRDEDKTLTRNGYKSRRGQTLVHARAAYEECGIKISEAPPNSLKQVLVGDTNFDDAEFDKISKGNSRRNANAAGHYTHFFQAVADALTARNSPVSLAHSPDRHYAALVGIETPGANAVLLLDAPRGTKVRTPTLSLEATTARPGEEPATDEWVTLRDTLYGTEWRISYGKHKRVEKGLCRCKRSLTYAFDIADTPARSEAAYQTAAQIDAQRTVWQG